VQQIGSIYKIIQRRTVNRT